MTKKMMKVAMKLSKVVYIGNPEFAIGPLKHLQKSEDFDIKLVITQMDKKRSRGKLLPVAVKEYAMTEDLPVFSTDNINSDESINTIKSVDPDFIIIVAFGQFLSRPFLNTFKDKVLNVHASILPQYRGASPINQSLLNGDDETGVSIMLVDSGMDSGDVLKICKLKIDENHNYNSLSEDLSELGGFCLVDTLRNFDVLFSNRMIQNSEEATYTGFITKDMGKIDFNEDAVVINNKMRALYNWPKLFFEYNDQTVKLHDFDIVEKFSEHEPGQIIKVNEEGIFVNCNDKCLVMKEIQFPGKKRMSVADYLKGNQIEKVKLR